MQSDARLNSKTKKSKLWNPAPISLKNGAG
jgi:hypothetical protein